MKNRLAVAAFCFFVASSAVFVLSSYDLWWHLAAGRYIAEGNGIPHADPFSFTAQGHEWIDHEWLFQLIVFATHSLAGVSGLIFLRAGLILISVLIVFRFVQRENSLPPPTLAFLLIPFVLAGRDRYLMRPELFTVLFAVLILKALHQNRSTPLGWRQLWWIPPLVALWANIHGGVIVGLVLLIAWACGLTISRLPMLGSTEESGKTTMATAWSLVLCSLAAGLCNPFTYLVYLVPFRLTALIESGVYDNLEWHRPSFSAHWLFYMVVALALLTVVITIRRRRFSALLQLMFLGLISLQYARNIALFSLLAPLLLTVLLRTQSTAGKKKSVITVHPLLATSLLFVVGIWLLVGDYRFPSGIDIARHRVPVGGVEFIDQHRPPGNLFNVYGFGGYVSWKLWPDVLTFIDGRNEVFIDVRRKLSESISDSRKWQALLNEYQIGYALVSYAKRYDEITIMSDDGTRSRVESWPYTVTHFPRRSWALVYWDDACMLYLRRSPEAASLIAAHEVEHVFPSFPDFQIEAFRKGWADPTACIAELQHKLEEDPECTRAERLLARIGEELSTAGRPDQP